MEILKFIYRLCKALIIFLIILLPLQLIGAIILLPTCYIVGNSFLPKFLRWFDNADSFVGRDDSTYLVVRATGPWNTYCWLAWRNPLNYFGYVVLGIKFTTEAQQTIYSGINSINVGDTTQAGFFYTEVEQDGSTYYEYYWIKLYNTTTCFRFRMGHKIGLLSKQNQFCEYVGIISPYHSYTGTLV